jgi:2-oxoglutarate dehydrogenase E2 component (dihydrolipoamide succinyltransferase)
MSYDHRIVDGSLGATFLTAVAKELEHFNGEREY